MKKCYYAGALALFAASGLTGCVDDSYDLADVDTTTRINVNDLVIPVNVAPIVLDQVIDLDSENIGTVRYGDKEFYAFHQSGDFHSDGPIHIPEVKVTAPEIKGNSTSIEQIIGDQKGPRKASPFEGACFSYEIMHPIGVDFEYSADDIDHSIVAVNSVRTSPFQFRVNLSISGTDLVKNVTLRDMHVSLPKGLALNPKEGQSYDPNTGLWLIDEVHVVENSPLAIDITADGVDFEKAGASINPSTHNLEFKGHFWVKSGYVDIYPKTSGVDIQEIQLPKELTLNASFSLDGFDIKSVSGRIHPDFAGLGIEPISLAGIPDFLKDPSTHLILANPEILFQVNDPAYNFYKGDMKASLSITPMRGATHGETLVPESPILLQPSRFSSADMSFVMAPDLDNVFYPENANADYSKNVTKIKYPRLGNILAGQGLPDEIKVDISIPEQEVVDFQLGKDLDQVFGHYYIVAPFALTDKSTILYSEDITGWGKDIENLVVNNLSITAKAHNGTPVSAEVTIIPLDAQGEVIPGPKITSTVLAPQTGSDFEVSLKDGSLEKFDGIRIIAKLGGSNTDMALSPTQTISLSDIKITVGGYYETELDND